MGLSTLVSTYWRKFGFFSTVQISKSVNQGLRIGIVIPSYFEELGDTLQSLSACRVQKPEEIELILVINHGETASEEVKHHHDAQLKKIPDQLSNGVPIHPIKAFDLPQKHAGVGLARKIGMDESLQRFGVIGYDGLIVCLDGDCTVSTNYLQSLLQAEEDGFKGLSIYYEHPFSALSADEQEAITCYEIFLRYYALGLQQAAYPFPFHTVGSSMAARASAYIKAGGMNKRKAGEDFYFLHKIFPQGQFSSWPHCAVYPSARISHRVPFGTGKAMGSMLEGQKNYTWLYHPVLFIELGKWLSDMAGIYKLNRSQWPETILHFLKSEQWEDELRDLTLRSKNLTQFTRNFYFWMDGFKILKYLHCNQESYPDMENIRACATLLGTTSDNSHTLLRELRNMEKYIAVTYI